MVPSIRFFATVSLLLLAVAVLGACGNGSSSSDTTTSDPSARALRILASANLRDVESGWFSGRFNLDNETRGEAIQWRGSIFFRHRGKRGTPQLNGRFEGAGVYDGADTRTSAGLVVAAGRGIIRHEGAVSEFPSGVLENPTQVSTGCSEALEAVRVGSLVETLRVKPAAATGTTLLEGTLDLPATLAALNRLIAPGACLEALEAAGISLAPLSHLEAMVARTVKKTEVAFEILEDNTLTGLTVGIWVESQNPKPEEVDGILVLGLTQVNRTKKVHEPLWAKRQGLPEAEEAQQQALSAAAGMVEALVAALSKA